MPRQSSHLLFLCISLMISLLPLRVQAALPKELPAAPTKFLTGACLTRSKDLWIAAEAGDIGNVPNRRLRRFGNSRRCFAADVGFRGKNVRSIHGEIIHPLNRSSSPPSCHGRQGAEPTGHLCQLSRLNTELLQLVVPIVYPSPHDAISPPNHRSSCSLHTSGNDVRRSLRVSDRGMSPVTMRCTIAGDRNRSRSIFATTDLS